MGLCAKALLESAQPRSEGCGAAEPRLEPTGGIRIRATSPWQGKSIVNGAVNAIPYVCAAHARDPPSEDLGVIPLRCPHPAAARAPYVELVSRRRLSRS